MKILASGDNHFDQDSQRFDECRRVHAWMVDTARSEGVDVFVDSGDIYERLSTPLEREAVAEWLTAMAEVCPVVIAKGNHDRSRDCALLGRLRTRHPVIVEEAAAVHYVAGAAIATMAWPERAYLLAREGSQAAADLAVRDALQAVLRGLGDELEQHDGPRILLGHFMVDGSQVSTGQQLLGMPINVGLADLALANAHLGIMGHIHMRQRFDVAGAPHLYTGSPFRTDFGQVEEKSVVLATFDGAALVELEELATPCSRMVQLEDEWGDGSSGEGWIAGLNFYRGPESVRGAEVRFRYNVAADRRDAAKSAAELIRDAMLAQGALHVKVEEVVVTEKRARAPEVATATSIVDKLDAYWKSVAFDPGERREALLAGAAELEGEARDAAA